MPTEITLFDVSLALCLASFLATMVCLLANAFPALIERLKQVTAVIGRTRPNSPRITSSRNGNRGESRLRPFRKRVALPSFTSNSVQ